LIQVPPNATAIEIMCISLGNSFPMFLAVVMAFLFMEWMMNGGDDDPDGFA
jgi:hypothetical protein